LNLKRELINDKFIEDKYDYVSSRIVEYLIDHQQESGTIYDEVNEMVTPDEQYAVTFFALASFILGRKKENQTFLSSAKKALNYYLNLPARKRGCDEFNNLALLIAYQQICSFDFGISDELKSKLENYIPNMTYKAYPGSGTSNNWFAIRAACHLLKGKLFNLQSEITTAEDLVTNHILKWQLDDGFFYDYPDKPHAEEYASPLTYHAKTCAMLSLCYELNPRPDVLEAIVNGLFALEEFIAPDGEAFYYGRSNNAIFGYASAIFAYEKAAGFITQTEERKGQQFRHYAEQLHGFFQRWQRADGHICVVTNFEEEAKVGWDVYTHNVVYNAYTAALLALLSEKQNEKKADQRVESIYKKASIYHAPNAGLLRIQNDDFFFTLSTRGQSIIKGSILFADLRYHGMNLLTLKYKGETIVPPPPLMWNLKHRNDLDLVDPRFCGFQPFFSIVQKGFLAKWRLSKVDLRAFGNLLRQVRDASKNRGILKATSAVQLQQRMANHQIEQLAAVRVYDDISVSEQDKGVAIFASGHPTIYRKPNYLYEMGTKVANRCRLGKAVFFKVTTLQDLRLHSCVICLFNEPLLLFVNVIENNNKIKNFKNMQFSSFSARILTKDFQVQGSKLRCEYQGDTLWLEKLFPDDGLDDLQNVIVATSRGSAHTLYQMTPISLEMSEPPVFISTLYFAPDYKNTPKFEFSTISPTEITGKITTQMSAYNISIFPKQKNFQLSSVR